MLDEKQQAARKGKMTGSRVKDLMTGDVDGIMRLYREMTDQATEEDIEYWEKVRTSLPVRTGDFNEPWILQLTEEAVGFSILRRGEFVVHREYPRFGCTLDGYVEDAAVPYVVEAKHVGGFESIDVIWGRYYPQCQWNMACTNSQLCALTVLFSNGAKHEIAMMEFNDVYVVEMQFRAKQFLWHVASRTPPIDILPLVPPPPRVREVDMRTNNMWCDVEHDYCETFDAAKINASRAEQLKQLVPADAKRAFGRLTEILVNKRGAKTIKRLNVEEEVA